MNFVSSSLPSPPHRRLVVVTAVAFSVPWAYRRWRRQADAAAERALRALMGRVNRVPWIGAAVGGARHVNPSLNPNLSADGTASASASVRSAGKRKGD
mgnify:CR=1 FL=1